MRRSRLLLLGLVVVAVLGGCDAPTRPDHDVRVENVAIEGTLGPDGVLALAATVTYPTAEGGPLTLGAPTLGTLRDVTVEGVPRRDSGDDISVDPSVQTATVAWNVDGAVERYADGAIVSIPIWTEAQDLSDTDTRIPVHATITLPAAPTGAVHWHGASPNRAIVDGVTVTLDGELGGTTDSELTFVLPAEAVPAAAVVPGAARVASFEDRQASKDAADAQIETGIRNDKRAEDIEAGVYWAAVGIEIAVPFLVAFLLLVRTASVRRKAAEGVPDELSDPPSDLRPAVVSLLHADAQDIGGEAIAASILELAQRGVLAIEGVTSEQYRIKVVGEGATPAETGLVAALRAAATSDGTVAGPPLPIPEGVWWGYLRKEVVIEARKQRLLRRRYPSGVFLTSVFALAITTIPLYARSPETLVAGFVVACVLGALPFLGGYVLTKDGYHARDQWDAYRNHLVNQGDLGDVGAPGIVVWGPHLVYGTALGVAGMAARDLTPSDIAPKEHEPA